MKIRAENRGFTLVELMVSLMLFAVLGTIVALFVRSYAASKLKTDMGVDVDRALALTSGRFESLLRGCRVNIPAVGTTTSTMEFQSPQTTPDGILMVDTLGAPLWDPPREVSITGGIVTVSGTEPVKLGRLGESGLVSFERVETRVLRITLVAVFDGNESIERKSGQLSFAVAVVP